MSEKPSIDELFHLLEQMTKAQLSALLEEHPQLAQEMADEKARCDDVIRTRGLKACAITNRKAKVLANLLTMRGP